MLAQGWSYITSNISEPVLWVMTSGVHTAVFVILNLILHLVHKYSLFERYRIQKQNYPSGKLLSEALKEVTRKHITGPILFWLLTPLARFCQVIDKVDPTKTPNSVLPSVQEVVLHILFFIIVQDTIFYWSHRMLHLRSLYSAIHKKHHRFHSNVGIASEFAHPLEDLANTLAFITGPLILGTHLFTLWAWFVVRIWETIDAHSGYALPFPLSPFSLFGVADQHDFHHSHNQGCYGSFFGFWDWIMGTDAAYKKWKAEGSKDEQVTKKNANKKQKDEQKEQVTETKASNTDRKDGTPAKRAITKSK